MVKRFILFCGVGLINTAAGLSAILLLLEVLGLQYMIANIGGYGFGLCLGFVLHKTITFQDREKPLPQVKSFLLVFGFAYAAQFIFLVLLVDFLGMNDALAQILSVGLYTVISYFGNSFVTFKKTGKGTP